ncbi:ghrelin O-acyltransferase [Boleophthalmus pectinirostris]|uniref:ghrelin O-acyltransferase n=1 Tax=Boleophthalmus pectinirostris TaxID=150288 RepID=UPI000A1C5100|nr:ghrelin O-acyltransferase [Boleophthalmus pectinirostris]
MSLLEWLWDDHQLLLQQSFSIPFGFLFYFLAANGFLSLRCRYLYMCIGGCILAVVTMGIYSILLFTSVFMFVVLVCTVDWRYIHTWVLGVQMLWQTLWHIFLQYKEFHQPQHFNLRLVLAVSSLMLITQRVTSVSMDIQDRRLILTLNRLSLSQSYEVLLPIISYILNFTTLLGGPLCMFAHFVSFIEGIDVNSPPNPSSVVIFKLLQVFLLECLRYSFLQFVKYAYNSNLAYGVIGMWAMAMVLRLHYYAHWQISECLNNAAGFGFCGAKSGYTDWSGLSDGDFWVTESSVCISQFARRWNATTASWLRRLVYKRCKYFSLLLTFGFSLWWHGLRIGHCIGFSIWAVTVNIDKYIERNWLPKLSVGWMKSIYVSLSWIITQIIIACIVITLELRVVQL